MRGVGGRVTAAVVLFAMAAVGCGSPKQDTPLPDSPAPEERPTASRVGDDPPPVPDPAPPPPPVSACAGIPIRTPSVSSEWASELLPRDYSCGYGTTDGLGSVIVLAENDFQHHETRATVLSPEGTRLNEYPGYRFLPLGQSSGFLGVNLISYAPYWLAALRHTGELIQETPPQSGDWPFQAEDPTGGLVLLVGQALTAYDATGTVRWSTTVTLSGYTRAIGVDRQGHTLILGDGDARFGAGTLEGIWVDPSGHASEPFLAAQRPASIYWFELYPQVGSGLFLLARGMGSVNEQGQWIAAFAALQPSSSPAPAWLASRPNTSLHMVHGGKGYALLPLPHESLDGCDSDIEVLAPSGESCATVRFSVPGTACARNEVWMGYDGTVLKSLPAECDEVGHCSCRWKWWPGIFR